MNDKKDNIENLKEGLDKLIEIIKEHERRINDLERIIKALKNKVDKDDRLGNLSVQM